MWGITGALWGKRGDVSMSCASRRSSWLLRCKNLFQSLGSTLFYSLFVLLQPLFHQESVLVLAGTSVFSQQHPSTIRCVLKRKLNAAPGDVIQGTKHLLSSIEINATVVLSSNFFEF